MRYLLLCLVGLSLWIGAAAQTDEFVPSRYCGVQMGRSPWLQKYQAAPHLYAKGGDTTLYIPLTIHLVGTDNGSGYFGFRSLLDALCTLNEDYAETNLQFFIEGPVRYLNRSDYYQHATVLEGAAMMFAENVPNTLNCYFVSDPAGNCGYNLPYAGIAMSRSCASPSDHTWAHEVGHALKLPHPFLGWEGGVSWDGSVTHNFNNPAPPTVTYDYTFFKDTLILDTLIIDTALVEKVDGSNCLEAADGFCDTTPDYIAGRWQCNNNGESATLQHDPDGQPFRSQGAYIMGYANDACQNIFTPEQMASMRAYLLDQRANWLYDQTPAVPITAAAILESPGSGEVLPANAVTLGWLPAPGATGYLVEVSRLSSFSAAVDAYTTTGTSLEISDLQTNRTYYWRVRPYNRHQFCMPFSASSSFVTGVMVNSQEPEALPGWQVGPNPLLRGQQLLVQHWELPAPTMLTLTLTDALGRQLAQWEQNLPGGNTASSLSLPLLPAGIYWLVAHNQAGRAVRKLVVQ